MKESYFKNLLVRKAHPEEKKPEKCDKIDQYLYKNKANFYQSKIITIISRKTGSKNK